MKNKKNEIEIDPTDEMIRGNKDEAGSTLRLWGKKRRKHILPNNEPPK